MEVELRESYGEQERWRADVDMHCTVRSDANVLLTGPAEVAQAVARKVHEESGWRHGPFILIDCSSPEGLMSRVTEAFTPTPAAGEPSLRLCQDGTVLLQEVGQMPSDVQAKLADLLVPQSGRRKCRVIASTSEWLLPRVTNGTFHDGLFYRLNAIHLLLAKAPGEPRDPERQVRRGKPNRLFRLPTAVRQPYSSRRASVG